MSEAEREKWDQMHRQGERLDLPPSWFLTDWLSRLPRVGTALDIACGSGRNAIYLAEAGSEVEGIDISLVGIDQAREVARSRGVEVAWTVADLDDYNFGDSAYDLITVIRYRSSGLWPRLIDALRPDGWLLVEHHFKTTCEVAGPSEGFKLDPQELLHAFGSLRIVHFEESVGKDPDRPERTVALQRLVACNGHPGF